MSVFKQASLHPGAAVPPGCPPPLRGLPGLSHSEGQCYSQPAVPARGHDDDHHQDEEEVDEDDNGGSDDDKSSSAWAIVVVVGGEGDD